MADRDGAELESAMQRAVSGWNAREHGLDPQLPVRALELADTTMVETEGAAVRAAATRTVVRVAADEPEALWGALQREQLVPRWDGDAAALERLLDHWLEEASWELPPGDAETALLIEAPSRDSALVVPLLARGFAAVGVTGIRVGARGADAGEAEQRLAAAGYALRPAGREDLDALAALDRELLEHDSRHGQVSLRPRAEEHLRAGIADRLAADPEWTWLLEVGGEAVGYLSIEVDRARHRESCAAGGPVAYVQAMYLRSDVRGAGIGDALAEFGHGRLEAAGYDRVLLSYAALNPRSGPFWSRHGYRPLWQLWQRRPVG